MINCSIKQALLIVVVSIATSVPALATVNPVFTITGDASGGNVNITNDNQLSTAPESVYAGTMNATLNGQAVTVFCVDPNHVYTALNAVQTSLLTAPVSSGTNSNGYYNGGLGTYIGNNSGATEDASNLAAVSAGTRQDEVAYLMDNYMKSAAASNVNGEALQLAIWDIITNGGDKTSDTPYTGNFSSNATGSTLADFDTYLKDAASQGNYTSNDVVWIQASTTLCPNAQDFAYIVPEPNVTAFLFSLTLAGGFMFYQKRRMTAVS